MQATVCCPLRTCERAQCCTSVLGLKLREAVPFYQEGVVTRGGSFLFSCASFMGQRTILVGNKISKFPNPALLVFHDANRKRGVILALHSAAQQRAVDMMSRELLSSITKERF